jgi:hypothetical protein
MTEVLIHAFGGLGEQYKEELAFPHIMMVHSTMCKDESIKAKTIKDDCIAIFSKMQNSSNKPCL